MFVSFDGMDGVGKSTQITLFCDWLRELGREVVCCRDPGSTGLGEQVRELLLNRQDLKLGPTSEMLLYMAARAQLVEELVVPALAAEKCVVSDRFLLANIVYQGYAGGGDVQVLHQIGAVAVQGVTPDLTIVLDLEVERALARVSQQPDRMESRGVAYFQRVRQGFLREAQRQPERIVVIDAGSSPDDVQAEIRQVAATWFPELVCAAR